MLLHVPRLSTFVYCLAFGVLPFLSGCAAERVTLTPEDYRARLPALEARVLNAPQDADALADLGEARAQTGAFAEAVTPLTRALALRTNHPKALYYRGVVGEGLGQRDDALAFYARYEEVPRTSPYRRLMAGRHAWLLRALVRDELAALIATEDSLTSAEPTDAVAVFPLRFRGGDEQYRTLGRGLSEMLAEDLAAVGRIRVVERVRLQVLLDELELGQSDAFDRATAPRLGRLLRSSRVVGGGVSVEGEALRADIALWDWPDAEFPELSAREARLRDLFRLEKEIAFGLIDELGIELTPAERERVERIPTRSLQAFLSYSRGLQEEDAGRFGPAAGHYIEAVRIDPGFDAARQKAEVAQALASAGGDVAEALEAGREEGPGVGDAGDLVGSLVGSRLTQLNGSLGAAVVPGEGVRDPAEIPVDVPTITPIAEPPPPPPPANDG